jgi:hypothetical protein
VTRDSARLNLMNETAVGIPDSTHVTMCKFNDASSQKYGPVWKAMKELADSAIADSVRCMLSQGLSFLLSITSAGLWLRTLIYQ